MYKKKDLTEPTTMPVPKIMDNAEKDALSARVKRFAKEVRQSF